ncbi:di-heme oxidoredictase family protein [Hufsiella ginkgonis]|uniref:Thiol oxidoreductase n=1 Tax=Hufsiella ginkgonis TaxID=2695274 RepID=A0A7K1XY98_9SPHI|nr:di-heme oxidoredictase family protein [Hufsiella ginkgonis]MXV15922.1 thiol oxidoreductase [Hufsiella ginkgonis]
MNKKHLLLLCAIFSLIVVMASCEKIFPPAPADDRLLDGPVADLTGGQNRQFLNGDIAFNDEVFTTETGLGPVFVATSCGSCHAGDGKGHPFSTLIRFTAAKDSTGNTVLDQGPTQLQNRAIPGFLPEQLPRNVPFSKFTPPANTGLGFIDLVPDADLLAMADPDDLNGDGISGAVNWNKIPPYVTIRKNTVVKNGLYICRFGKKGSVYDLLQQTATAYNQDMGITSSFEPVDTYSGLEIDPEVSDKTVNDVVFYLKTLKAPIQRMPGDPEVVKGKAVFIRIGCESCHKQTLTTGTSTIAALSNRQFYPYTDLLLHDMGNALDDGFTEGSAKTSEWKTPALWGLGLSKNSQGGRYFLLHDGRARSIEEAILFHGGEGLKSKTSFQGLGAEEKSSLIHFLESL